MEDPKREVGAASMSPGRWGGARGERGRYGSATWRPCSETPVSVGRRGKGRFGARGPPVFRGVRVGTPGPKGRSGFRGPGAQGVGRGEGAEGVGFGVVAATERAFVRATRFRLLLEPGRRD